MDLIRAAVNGNLGQVKELLANGANPDLRDDSGEITQAKKKAAKKGKKLTTKANKKESDSSSSSSSDSSSADSDDSSSEEVVKPKKDKTEKAKDKAKGKGNK